MLCQLQQPSAVPLDQLHATVPRWTRLMGQFRLAAVGEAKEPLLAQPEKLFASPEAGAGFF